MSNSCGTNSVPIPNNRDWNIWPKDCKTILINKSLSQIVSIITSDSSKKDLYYYVTATVESSKDLMLYNSGSGPNFQGGVVTLCTCKRYMRLTGADGDFRGVWIAGVSSLPVAREFGMKSNVLFYIGKVKEQFHHYGELIEYLEKNYPGVKDFKDASKNIRGDIFIPNETQMNPEDYLNPNKYIEPITGHVHNAKNKEWHYDINYYYPYIKDKSSKYLLFDPKMTFVWNKPLITLNKDCTWGCKKATITSGVKRVSKTDFCNALKEVKS